MLGVELALFIIVGAIAILAAVMMLVSENAVHAALFLILNFACVAFFYLMLSAPFLAMVQVTVYAGAIMVLFLFVIMLLGAEKQTPESSPRFSWLSPAAVGLTLVFLLVAGIAIIRSDVDASEPPPEQPLVRVVHAGGDTPAVDVYLDGDVWVEDLAFREVTEFQPLPQLEDDSVEGHVLAIYEEGADPETDEPLLSETIGAGEDDVFTYIVMPNTEGILSFTAVEGNLDALDDTNDTRLAVVNAFPCESGNCAVDIADVTNPDEDPFILVENLAFGEVSVSKVVEEGDYTLAAFPAGEIDAYLERASTDEEAEFDVERVANLDDEVFEGNHSVLWIVSANTEGDLIRSSNILLSVENDMQFGSGQALGRSLFTRYMLPFQAIALLLLVAMVGVIVMTNPLETTKPTRRERRHRRMANVPGNPTVDEYRRSISSNGD